MDGDSTYIYDNTDIDIAQLGIYSDLTNDNYDYNN